MLIFVLPAVPFALAAAKFFLLVTGFQQTEYVVWSTAPLFSSI